MHTFIIAAITIDGFIASREDQVSTDWTSKADKQFFRDRTKEAGVMVMGRKTFETIGRALPGRETIVMSRQKAVDRFQIPDSSLDLRELDSEILNFKFQIPNSSQNTEHKSQNTIYTTQLSPQELVSQLDKAGVRELAVCGGASIYQQFLEAGVVDTLYLTIEPVMFGDGVKLVGEIGEIGELGIQGFQLQDVRRLGDEGTVLLSYKVTNEKRM